MKIHKNITMKKTITIALLVLILASTIVMFSGCSGKELDIWQTRYFTYMYNEENDGVIILELTEEGKEQEILVLPEKIDGLPVIQLGYERSRRFKNDDMFAINNVDTKIKKVYWNSSCIASLIELNDCEIVFGAKTNIKSWGEESIVFPESNFIYANNFGKIIANKPYHSFYMFGNKYFTNIKYYVENELYYVDNTSKDNLYLVPNNPRKDGKEFVGWFYEKIGINKWDGSYPQSQEEELNLYAKFVYKVK